MFTFLAALVVFWTTYALILPAITLETTQAETIVGAESPETAELSAETVEPEPEPDPAPETEAAPAASAPRAPLDEGVFELASPEHTRT